MDGRMHLASPVLTQIRLWLLLLRPMQLSPILSPCPGLHWVSPPFTQIFAFLPGGLSVWPCFTLSYLYGHLVPFTAFTNSWHHVTYLLIYCPSHPPFLPLNISFTNLSFLYGILSMKNSLQHMVSAFFMFANRMNKSHSTAFLWEQWHLSSWFIRSLLLTYCIYNMFVCS